MLKSFGRPQSADEADWQMLVVRRAESWPLFPDSSAIPFSSISLPDTVFCAHRLRGADDGFTHEMDPVCFDLTALQNEYGKADCSENAFRIDRLFAHEYAHLLSKQWLAKQGYASSSIADNVFWECWYEGLGIYRSRSQKNGCR